MAGSDDRPRRLSAWLGLGNLVGLGLYFVFLQTTDRDTGQWGDKLTPILAFGAGLAGVGIVLCDRRVWRRPWFVRARARLKEWAELPAALTIVFTVLMFLRHGFVVHAPNDNLLYLAYFAKALHPERFSNDLLFSTGFLVKSAFFEVFKYPAAWLGWYWSQFTGYAFSIALFLAGSLSLAKAVGIRSVWGRLWILLFASIPDIFGGAILLDRYFTLRTVGSVGLVWAMSYYARGRDWRAGLLAGATTILHATTGLPAAGAMIASTALTLPGDTGRRFRRAATIAAGAGLVLVVWSLAAGWLHPDSRYDFPYFENTGPWVEAITLRQPYVYVENWSPGAFAMLVVVLVLYPLAVGLMDRLGGQPRAPGETRLWHVVAWVAAYSASLTVLTALFPLPAWILLSPLTAMKAGFLSAAVLLVKSCERLAESRPGLAAVVALLAPLSVLVYGAAYAAVAAALICLGLIYAMSRPPSPAPQAFAPAARWLLSSLALPVIWFAAVGPLQMVKSAVEGQAPIGHGFFSERNFSNLEPPPIGGRLLYPDPYLSSDFYSAKQRLFRLLSDRSAPEVLISFPEGDGFADARYLAGLGLYYAWKDGASLYYSSSAFAEGWLHRRRVNGQFFASDSPPAQVRQAAVEMWDAGVRWVVAAEPLDDRAEFLTPVFHEANVWGYAFAVPPTP